MAYMGLRIFLAKATGVEKVLRKVNSMSIVMIAPELGIFMAVMRHLQAKKLCWVMGEGWTMTHAFYANMGGFAFRSRNSLDKAQASSGRSDEACEQVRIPNRGGRSRSIIGTHTLMRIEIRNSKQRALESRDVSLYPSLIRSRTTVDLLDI